MADLELELGMEELGEGLGEDLNEPEVPVEEQEEAAFASDDTEGFAKGFPEWDLLPPKKQK